MVCFLCEKQDNNCDLTPKFPPGVFLRFKMRKKNMKGPFRGLPYMSSFLELRKWLHDPIHRPRRDDVHMLVLDDHEYPQKIRSDRGHGIFA